MEAACTSERRQNFRYLHGGSGSFSYSDASSCSGSNSSPNSIIILIIINLIAIFLVQVAHLREIDVGFVQKEEGCHVTPKQTGAHVLADARSLSLYGPETRSFVFVLKKIIH
jgi:hypothetical protein